MRTTKSSGRHRGLEKSWTLRAPSHDAESSHRPMAHTVSARLGATMMSLDRPWTGHHRWGDVNAPHETTRERMTTRPTLLARSLIPAEHKGHCQELPPGRETFPSKARRTARREQLLTRRQGRDWQRQICVLSNSSSDHSSSC
jgi:hypothetical protein